MKFFKTKNTNKLFMNYIGFYLAILILISIGGFFGILAAYSTEDSAVIRQSWIGFFGGISIISGFFTLGFYIASPFSIKHKIDLIRIIIPFPILLIYVGVIDIIKWYKNLNEDWKIYYKDDKKN